MFADMFHVCQAKQGVLLRFIPVSLKKNMLTATYIHPISFHIMHLLHLYHNCTLVARYKLLKFESFIDHNVHEIHSFLRVNVRLVLQETRVGGAVIL